MKNDTTITSKFCQQVKDLPVRIVDTRKTTPGLRILEKYAVRMGGGYNHRFGLYDAVLIKDNHIAVAGGIKSAVNSIRKQISHMIKIEVEVENLTEELKTTLRELLCYGIFIDAGHSNNSDGRLSRKLYFRRIYTPAFPTTFHTRNTFPMRKNSFEKFIYEPANFARARMSEDNISPDEQQKIEQLELWD